MKSPAAVSAFARGFRLLRRSLRAAIACAGIAVASAATAGDNASVIDCPHCGTWELVHSEPNGAAGERIVVGSQFVTLPTCGEFQVEEVDRVTIEDQDERRRYRVVLRLRPYQPDRLCASADDGLVRLEVTVSDGYKTNAAGAAELMIFRDGSDAPSLTAQGWNYARDNPCDSGSGKGSLACLVVANARLYRNLAQATYDAHASVPATAAMRAPGSFNPAKFAAATLAFCQQREADSGGGQWPSVWALNCQAERLQDKMAELRAFRTCVAAGGERCSFPTERFDRSRSIQ